ncbi:MAG: endo-1,4-beta-xylanase [Chloroflexi bacterium]|nr:endo-1,4-beta-xylanase [Chloroflexota bacterium]
MEPAVLLTRRQLLQAGSLGAVALFLGEACGTAPLPSPAESASPLTPSPASPAPSSIPPLDGAALTDAVSALGTADTLTVPGGVALAVIDLEAAGEAVARAGGSGGLPERDPVAALGYLLAAVDWSGVTGAVELGRFFPNLSLPLVRLPLARLPDGGPTTVIAAALPAGLTVRTGAALLVVSHLAEGTYLIAIDDPARPIDGNPRLELGVVPAAALSPLLAVAGARLDAASGAVVLADGTGVTLRPLTASLADRLTAAAGVLFVDRVPLQPKGAKTPLLTVDPYVPAPGPSVVTGATRVAPAADGRVLALNAAGTAVGRAQYIGGATPWSWLGKDGLDWTLRELADRIGWRVGVELTGWEFNDQHWQSIVRAQFNQGLLSWGLDWNEVEPARGQYDFSVMDRLVAFAQANGMRVRADSVVFGHTSMLPSWLVQGHFSAAQLTAILQAHVRAVVSQYRGVIAEWVVVNEPYVAPYSTDDLFYQALGYDYIDVAFAAARKADPSAVLNFSDTANHTAAGITTNLTMQTVTRLEAKGLVDIVGLQMHLDGANPPDPTDVRDTMRRYGLPVAVTSLDIDLSDVPGTLADRYAVQAKIAASMLRAARDSGVCRDFSVWGIGDGVADRWLQRPGAPAPTATPFDGQLRPKPFFSALLKGMS